MSSTKLQMELNQDRTMITRESVAKRIIEVVITAPTPKVRTNRLPLNLALVLDRSGSMGGQKLHFVQQAACHLLDQLNERDQVSIVSFDNITEIVAANGCISPATREAWKRNINSLTARGGTDLFSGWLHGANETAEHLMPSGVNRILLLTDVQANAGETRQPVLEQHAQELRKRGVSTSTFGVGTDFNQFLLEGMAEQGGGHYYFIEHPDQIPALFRQELGELMTVMARRAHLEVTVPAGASLTLLGEIPHESTGNRLHLPLGDFFAGEKRYFYFELLTPTSHKAAEQTVPFDLTWMDDEGVPSDLHQTVRFLYGTEAETWSLPADTALRSRAALIRAATAERTALRLATEGRTAEAASILEGITQKYGTLLGPEKTEGIDQLRTAIAQQTLSPAQSVAAHKSTYRARASRA